MLTGISKKCEYALRAVFELALREGAGPVKSHQIAAVQLIPVRFLETILAELRKGGILESKRGSDGGYVLARPADQLTIGQLLSCLQTTNSPAAEAAVRRTNYDLPGSEGLAKVWNAANRALWRVYGSTTFADLVADELSRRRRYVPNYAI